MSIIMKKYWIFKKNDYSIPKGEKIYVSQRNNNKDGEMIIVESLQDLDYLLGKHLIAEEARIIIDSDLYLLSEEIYNLNIEGKYYCSLCNTEINWKKLVGESLTPLKCENCKII